MAYDKDKHRKFDFILDKAKDAERIAYLESIMRPGYSVADFIRDAIDAARADGHFGTGQAPVVVQAAPPTADPMLADLLERIVTVQERQNDIQAQQTQAATPNPTIPPGSRASPIPGPVIERDLLPAPTIDSGGIDMSSPRRKRTGALPPPTLPEEQPFDEETARRLLISSINAFGNGHEGAERRG